MRILVVSISLLYSLACGAQPKPAVLFTAGPSQVAGDEFTHIYKKNHSNQPDAFTEPKIQEYLDLYINFKLKVSEAKNRGLDTTAKFTKEFKTYRQDLRKPFTATPDALEQAARETYARLTEEVRAAHILFRLPESPSPSDTLAAYQKCLNVLSRIQAGEDFHKLAAELSEDPSAKYNQGDLGFFTAMQMVYPFEKAAYELAPGQVSKPVRTRFGYHLIQTKARQPARGEVEVSHILLRKTGNDDTAVKNKIFSVDEQLKKGRAWEDVCKEFSEDANTKDVGGKLRPFGVGALASVPEFETVAFALRDPGQVSDPFSSNIGWHIIKLEKRIPLPSYQELEASLKKKVARDERLQVSRKKIDQQRKQLFTFSENSTTKQQILALADSTLSKGKWNYPGTETLAKQPLFTIASKNYPVSAFISYIRANQNATPQKPEPYMAQLYDSFVEDELALAEEQKLLQENPEFRHLLTEYRDGILLFEIMEKEVWNKASEDSIGLVSYYEKNKSKYTAGERVTARVFSATHAADLDVIEAKLKKGDTLTLADTKKLKSAQPWRNYEPNENKWVDAAGKQPGTYRSSSENVFYLVEVKGTVPAGIKSLDEARINVITDYQDQLEKEWVTSLRSKYPVKVNKKTKKAIVKELLKKK